VHSHIKSQDSRSNVVAHTLLGDFAGHLGVRELLVGDDDIFASVVVLLGQLCTPV
jgi:hypothetical protein